MNQYKINDVKINYMICLYVRKQNFILRCKRKFSGVHRITVSSIKRLNSQPNLRAHVSTCLISTDSRLRIIIWVCYSATLKEEFPNVFGAANTN